MPNSALQQADTAGMPVTFVQICLLLCMTMSAQGQVAESTQPLAFVFGQGLYRVDMSDHSVKEWLPSTQQIHDMLPYGFPCGEPGTYLVWANDAVVRLHAATGEELEHLPLGGQMLVLGNTWYASTVEVLASADGTLSTHARRYSGSCWPGPDNWLAPALQQDVPVDGRPMKFVLSRPLWERGDGSGELLLGTNVEGSHPQVLGIGGPQGRAPAFADAALQPDDVVVSMHASYSKPEVIALIRHADNSLTIARFSFDATEPIDRLVQNGSWQAASVTVPGGWVPSAIQVDWHGDQVLICGTSGIAHMQLDTGVVVSVNTSTELEDVDILSARWRYGDDKSADATANEACVLFRHRSGARGKTKLALVRLTDGVVLSVIDVPDGVSNLLVQG